MVDMVMIVFSMLDARLESFSSCLNLDISYIEVSAKRGEVEIPQPKRLPNKV